MWFRYFGRWMSEMSWQLIIKCVIMTEIGLTCKKEDWSAVLWKVNEQNLLVRSVACSKHTYRKISIWYVACSFYRKVLMVTQPVTKHTALQRVYVSACGSACSLPTQLQPVSSCVWVFCAAGFRLWSLSALLQRCCHKALYESCSIKKVPQALEIK